LNVARFGCAPLVFLLFGRILTVQEKYFCLIFQIYLD